MTTERAEADVRDIATYIAIDSNHAAQQFGMELWDCHHRIAEHPDIGYAVPDFVDLCMMRVSSHFWHYFIFYRSFDAETTNLVRVLHGARDLTALLRDIAEDDGLRASSVWEICPVKLQAFNGIAMFSKS